MSSIDIRAIVDHYIDAYNRKNIDDMLMNVHPQIEFKNISAGVVNARTNGVTELRTLAQQSLSLFSERQQKIESFELQGSVAVATIAFRAVVAADLPNGLKKGQVLNFSGRSEFEFQDGAISKITDIS
ncbi:nuclear transport factor 2 family protein [Azoarcus sp. L1K30]|uniref:nuclear transport factor 2 family protein n=1 Tax=Azoarcus sp. L1K30 TaxID=2820277 RepID=UPI001B828184|nr:nuclear transport factor 2 family protein [Azoarcus sp. L1K30]MBR0566890.1 nuclear transport factor 2 family protein [Azoarcus sp. L1K30]